jgi:hypothetical protein
MLPDNTENVDDPSGENLPENTLIDYLCHLITKIIKKMNANFMDDEISIQNEVYITFDKTSIYEIYLATSTMAQRELLIENGSSVWKEMKDSLMNPTNS